MESTKDLTANDLANLEKIAALRGYAGKLRAAIQKADELIDRHTEANTAPAAIILGVHLLLSRALETPVPEDGR